MRLRLAITLLFLFSSTAVRAQNFQTISNITYNFDKQGTANVINEISIINQVDNLYVSEYTVTLDDSQIKNFTARDLKGNIVPQFEKKDDKTIVKLKLNDAVVGKKQINSFVFRYISNEYAKKLGNNYEIHLPLASQNEGYLDYHITIKIPDNFGRLSSSSPKPESVDNIKGETTIKYGSIQGNPGGIYLLFGDYQIYQVKWQVQLYNDTQSTIRHFFPLIPDTTYQKTFQKLIEPLPNEMASDEDGNWLAYYQLNPSQLIEVNGETLIKVFPKSQNNLLPPDNYLNYLTSTEFWQSSNPIITDVSKKLTNIKDVYKFVVDTLFYDYDGILPSRPRYGAIYALRNPNKAVCSEYSDLFIALARSIGVPARGHEGFAFSNDKKLQDIYENKDVLHAWPEYYDQSSKSWIMVDPTFGDTSGGIDYLNNFDNSHITFAIHGLNDKLPVPIGAYKIDDQKEYKQVNTIILSITDLPDSYQVSFDPSNINQSFNVFKIIKSKLFNRGKDIQGPYLSLINQKLRLNFQNTSGYPIKLIVQGNNDILMDNVDNNVTILPWQKFTLSGYVRPNDQYRRYSYQGNITVNNNQYYFTLPVFSTLALLFYFVLFLVYYFL